MQYPKSGDGRIFFDLARDRLNLQIQTLDAIDAKIAVLFGTSTTLVGILAAVLALRTENFGIASDILVGVSIIAYGVSAWHGWRGYRALKWKSGPLLWQVFDAYVADPREFTDDEMTWEIADHIRLDYEENEKKMTAKSDALDRIGIALLVQTVTLAASLVLVAS